jgi:hypothetical protein
LVFASIWSFLTCSTSIFSAWFKQLCILATRRRMFKIKSAQYTLNP